MNKKKRKSISSKTKKYLQKEIHSECPICKNQEVGHFQIHHIDENPQNDDFQNLIMLCPICHSKITKGEILMDEVLQLKKNLLIFKKGIEKVAVFVDEKKYNWVVDDDIENVFFSKYNNESISPHLVLNWSFINHSSETIVLKSIEYIGVPLPTGLNGPTFPIEDFQSSIISSLIKYEIPVFFDKKKHLINLIDQIQIPKNKGFQFQTELFSQWDNEIYHLKGRFYIDFTFYFSNNIVVKSMRLLFNSKSDNEEEKLPYYGIN